MTKSLEPGLASQGTCRRSGCRSWSIDNTKATYSFSSVSRFDTIDSSKIVMKRSVCFCITASINIPHGGLCIAIKDSQRKPQGQIWEAWTWIVSQPGVARKGRWFSPRSILRVPGMSSNAKVKYWATPVNCINKKSRYLFAILNTYAGTTNPAIDPFVGSVAVLFECLLGVNII